ncbi:ATP-binding cassette domain-containing protein [Micromonospora yangpuensis]|uniref:Peptide/nickel transport system ATP-binding protein n=1 Tax=Micromonospora yangpuensis TaxID=683228 RepID=A0A1C6U146_9ACTN|nr:ATP-binding cassette domain-containing protein [Micromonospora yangpuensis]SCL47774.1 peptide/nickel transport system ATP-binding protein [Micromonospora yangpuensis]
MSRTVLRVAGLRAEAGRHRLLDDVSFTLAAGRVLAVVGASGSGKTTLGRALLGEAGPGVRLTGRIEVAGRTVTPETPPPAGSISYVPQQPAAVLNPVRRVGAVLHEIAGRHMPPGGTRRARRHRVHAAARAALRRVSLPDDRDLLRRFPHQLSGGQQQRLVIAHALLAGARSLVADEPTTGQDNLTRRDVATELVGLARGGIAVVLLSHDLDLVRMVADELLVLHRGEPVEYGPTGEVFAAGRHEWTRRLLATRPVEAHSATNQTGTTVEAGTATDQAGTVVVEAGTATDQAGTVVVEAGTATDQAGTVVVEAGTATDQAGTVVVEAGTATDQAGTVVVEAGTATDQAGTVVVEAGTATDQAGTATGQAGTVVVEAGPATDQAGTVVVEAGPATDQAGTVVVEAGTGTGQAGTVDGQAVLAVVGLVAEHSSAGRRRTVLEGVGLDLAAGKCLALVGRSGSGKTTLARCVVGLHRPRTGTVALAGRPLAATVDRRRRAELAAVQYVFQDARASFDPWRPVVDQVARPAVRLHGRSTAAARKAARAALERVGLTGSVVTRDPGRLSGGELHRAALARALLAEPRVLVCDEITAGLDAVTRDRILALVDGLRRVERLALLVITHDRDVVARLADRVAVLHDGRVIEDGPATTLLTSARQPLSRSLLHLDGADAQPDRR